MAAKSEFIVHYKVYGGKPQRRNVQLGRDVTPDKALDDIRSCLAESHKLFDKDSRQLKPHLIILLRIHRKGTQQVWEDANAKPEPPTLPTLKALQSMSKLELMDMARNQGVEIEPSLDKGPYAAALLKAMTAKQAA